MTNVDSFKSFVRKNPNLVTYVRNGSMSWQKFYELYDLYGEEKTVWKDYLIKEENREVKELKPKSSSGNTLSNILEMAKNLDTNKIQDGITSIQKAISLFGDMLSKDTPDANSAYTPRPIYRRFDD